MRLVRHTYGRQTVISFSHGKLMWTLIKNKSSYVVKILKILGCHCSYKVINCIQYTGTFPNEVKRVHTQVKYEQEL